MANQEHLDKQWRFVYNLIDKLLEGVSTWNKWREDNPYVIPGLSGVDLSFTDLRGANLSNANLIDANLSFADLHYAYLGNANLGNANLTRADLGKAIYNYDTQWPEGLTNNLLTEAGAVKKERNNG